MPAQLKVGNIDSERMLIVVERGKVDRQRHGLLSLTLLALLRAWWHEGRRLGVMRPGGCLFPGQHPAKPITTRQLSRVVEDAAEAAGLTKNVSPHTLRHSFATHLLEDGTDISSSPSTNDPTCTTERPHVIVLELGGRRRAPPSRPNFPLTIATAVGQQRTIAEVCGPAAKAVPGLKLKVLATCR